MGQLIKKLQPLPFLDGETYIELNDTIYGDEKIIHFHYKNIRYEISESDYLMILAGIIVANKSLEKLKDE